MKPIKILVTKEILKQPIEDYKQIPNFQPTWSNLNGVARAIGQHPYWATIGPKKLGYITCTESYFFLKTEEIPYEQFNLDLYTRCWMEDWKRRGTAIPEIELTIDLDTKWISGRTPSQVPAWHLHLRYDKKSIDKDNHRIVKFLSPTQKSAKQRAHHFLNKIFLPDGCGVTSRWFTWRYTRPDELVENTNPLITYFTYKRIWADGWEYGHMPNASLNLYPVSDDHNANHMTMHQAAPNEERYYPDNALY